MILFNNAKLTHQRPKQQKTIGMPTSNEFKRVQTRSQATQKNDTPNNKRSHSPQNEENNTKKTKTATMSTQEFAELKKLIEASSESIGNKIDSSQKSLELKFTELATKVEGDVSTLKSSMDEFKAEISGELHDVKVQQANHTHRIENTEDDIQRIQRSHDLRVTGFHVKENENLLEIFEAIAKEIGFEANSQLCAPSIDRIPVKNRTAGQMIKSPTILIHFTALKQKQSFYSYYLNKMPLKPENFGLPTMNRNIIGENLTRENAQLFKQAQIMRREGKIAQTFTEDGLVKIRIKKGSKEPTYTVRNHITLETIVEEHVQAAALLSAQSNDNSTNSITQPADIAPINTTNNVSNTQQTPMDTDGMSKQ